MRLLFYLLFFSTTSGLLWAQKDYVVTLKGDTTFGKINIRSTNFYDEVEIKTESNKESIRSFFIDIVKIGDDLYRPIPYQNKKILAKIMVEGADLSYYLVRPEDAMEYSENILLNRDNESLSLSAISFRKRTIDFLDDCQFIVAELEDKTFSYNELDKITELYNLKCGTSNPIITTEKENKTDTITPLASASEIILDVLRKLKAGEPIPSYQMEALKKQREIDLNDELQKLIEKVEGQER